jgi:hypothetical protein
MKTLPAHQIKSGMTVFFAGEKYIVRQSLHDKHGLSANRASHILICDGYTTNPTMFGSYSSGIHFGLAPSQPVAVEA